VYLLSELSLIVPSEAALTASAYQVYSKLSPLLPSNFAVSVCPTFASPEIVKSPSFESLLTRSILAVERGIHFLPIKSRPYNIM